MFAGRYKHQVKLGRCISQQVGYRITYFGIGYPVVIIQEQIDVIVDIGQIVDPRGYDGVERHQSDV